jgi:predicted MPP superfamily phosphohydrolase
MSPAAEESLRAVLLVLSSTFVAAAIASFRYANRLVDLIYWIAALWLGMLNFLFVAACLAWVIDFPLSMIVGQAALQAIRPPLIASLSFAALLAALYGLVNARIIRHRHITVKLPNLPQTWKGRSALVMSDLHLGNINRRRFSTRLAAVARKLDPSIILIPGDVFDGGRTEPEWLAGPLFELRPPLGTYCVLGNHDEFAGAVRCAHAMQNGGFHVLQEESVDVDGLTLIGVSYRQSTRPVHLRGFLDRLQLNGSASVLLQHVPNRLSIIEQAGISLQISGHTHGGQIFPFSWVTHRAFGRFTYGMHKHGSLQVYTSSGAGTWGPPMRVGTNPEVVLLTFE